MTGRVESDDRILRSGAAMRKEVALFLPSAPPKLGFVAGRRSTCNALVLRGKSISALTWGNRSAGIVRPDGSRGRLIDLAFWARQHRATPRYVTSPTMILATPGPTIVLTRPVIVSIVSLGNWTSTTCELGTGNPAASMTMGRGKSWTRYVMFVARSQVQQPFNHGVADHGAASSMPPPRRTQTHDTTWSLTYDLALRG